MNTTGNPRPASQAASKRDTSAWKAIVRKYQEPSLWRAVWQLVDTLGPYGLLWYLMYRSLAWSYWITFALAILAGLFLVRNFIIFHDCGHGSFFKARLANDIVGFITGVLTFTPYYHWRWEHSIHHASSGDLDRRGTGDLWTLTVQEYLRSSRLRRFAYRLARNPFVLFGIAPIYLLLIQQRFPSAKANPRECESVHWMNLALLGVAAALSLLFGVTAYVLIQLIIVMVGGGVGIWMFYVQHQFEDVYWERDGNWDFTAAALQGSSFYKLPGILQWFSGNIWFHHIHHLSPRIPNYNLERCHKADPLFQEVKPLTLCSSLKSLGVHLWDEQRAKLVGFRYLRKPPPTHGPEKAVTLALSLAQAERAIEAFGAGQVDAIVDTDGRAYLLRPAQERMRANESRLQAIIDSAADVIMDRSGVILFHSRAVSRVLGYEPEELVGQSLFELIYEEDLDRLYTAFFNVIEGFLEHVTVRFYHPARDGTYRLIEATVGKLKDATTPSMVLIFRPVTGSSPESKAPAELPALMMMPASENRDCIILSHGRSIPLHGKGSWVVTLVRPS